MRSLILLAAALAAAPAAAQPADGPATVREQPIDEVAADLAYGFCPLFLAGQLSLTGPELAERGFAKTVVKQPHPRVGEMSLVGAKLPDGQVQFGGAAGKACTVVVSAPKSTRAAVIARLRSNMAFMGLDFKPAPNPGPSVPALKGATIETFKAPVDKQFLYLQHVQMDEPAGIVVAQLFATDK
ncbi:MAG TPA: hypothetical protein VFQ67_05705 [Allosphingosinicella sp.]|jgi:hypothetical protein|nr:hypothetical protein [Allosphingosinicella sp.]